MPRRTALLALVAFALFASPCWSADTWRVSIKGTSDLGETAVIAEINAAVPKRIYQLEPSGSNGTAILAQVFTDAGKTYLSTVLKHVDGGKAMAFTLRPATVTPSAPGVEVRPSGADLDVLIEGKPLTTYRAESGPKPYYFPVIGPTGAAITRTYPMKDVPGEDRDHPHQRSMWFTHGKVNGIDFWSETKGHGTIKETAREIVAAGPVVVVIRTADDWLGADGAKVCSDERTFRVFDVATGRVMDFDITIKATAGPVTFGDTKEGMFGLRVASSMDVAKKKGGKITNAEGIADDAAWGKASRWVDYTGPVEGKTVGMAVLNHPESFRYPTTWHVRPYGLFAANPFGWHDFGMGKSGEHVIPAGSSIRFRYRVILHEGDTGSAHLPEAFRSYSEPVSIAVEAS